MGQKTRWITVSILVSWLWFNGPERARLDTFFVFTYLILLLFFSCYQLGCSRSSRYVRERSELSPACDVTSRCRFMKISGLWTFFFSITSEYVKLLLLFYFVIPPGESNRHRPSVWYVRGDSQKKKKSRREKKRERENVGHNIINNTTRVALK